MLIVRVVKISISAVVFASDWSIEQCSRVVGRHRNARCVILYYHAVREESRVRFARQMDLLVRLSTPIDLEDRIGWPPSGRCTAVTFDDAFQCIVDNALPELSARRIPCTVFVPSGLMGQRPAWIGESHSDYEEIIASPEAIRAIAHAHLVRVGSHSETHPDFNRIAEEDARHELTASKRTLESIVGHEVRSFSFPHGSCTPKTISLAHQAGYSCVYTIEPESVRLPLQEPSVVGRVRVEPDEWPVEFRLKLLGAYRWMRAASSWKRKLFNAGRVGFHKRHRPSGRT